MAKRLKNIAVLIPVLCFVACATAYDKHGTYHIVRKGETVWKIARYYHVPLQDLAEWNNIEDANEIHDGLKLYIPRGAPSKSAAGKKKTKLTRKEKSDVPIRLERSRFAWPVDGAVLSPFGIRNGRRHDGVDIRAKSGEPIEAAASGKVVFSGQLRGYGNMLIVRHKDRFFTVYAHNSKNAVKKGQKVAKGELIGYVGSTGRATGPHLHFEVREGQKARNPLFLLPAEASASVAVAKKGGNIKDAVPDVKSGEKFSRRKEMMEKLLRRP